MSDLVAAPARKDVVRNRARLLEAASELFSEEGLDVTLKDVAQRAGVGVGTVYRHFPKKDELISALFADQLDREVDRARQVAAEPDGFVALVEYIRGVMRTQAENPGLRALYRVQGSTNPALRNCRALIEPWVQRVIDTAHRQGTLRADFTADDVIYIQVALIGVIDASPVDTPYVYERHLRLFIDGMRATATSRVQVPAQ